MALSWRARHPRRVDGGSDLWTQFLSADATDTQQNRQMRRVTGGPAVPPARCWVLSLALPAALDQMLGEKETVWAPLSGFCLNANPQTQLQSIWINQGPNMNPKFSNHYTHPNSFSVWVWHFYFGAFSWLIAIIFLANGADFRGFMEMKRFYSNTTRKCLSHSCPYGRILAVCGRKKRADQDILRPLSLKSENVCAHFFSIGMLQRHLYRVSM